MSWSKVGLDRARLGLAGGRPARRLAEVGAVVERLPPWLAPKRAHQVVAPGGCWRAPIVSMPSAVSRSAVFGPMPGISRGGVGARSASAACSRAEDDEAARLLGSRRRPWRRACWARSPTEASRRQVARGSPARGRSSGRPGPGQPRRGRGRPRRATPAAVGTSSSADQLPSPRREHLAVVGHVDGQVDQVGAAPAGSQRSGSAEWTPKRRAS